MYIRLSFKYSRSFPVSGRFGKKIPSGEKGVPMAWHGLPFLHFAFLPLAAAYSLTRVWFCTNRSCFLEKTGKERRCKWGRGEGGGGEGRMAWVAFPFVSSDSQTPRNKRFGTFISHEDAPLKRVTGDVLRLQLDISCSFDWRLHLKAAMAIR